MRVSFKIIARLQKQHKDKTIPVNIRIGWQSKYSFLTTKYLVTKSDLNKKGEIKPSIITDSCNEIIRTYREITENITNIDNLDIQDIVEIIKLKTDGGDNIDFIKFFQNQLAILKEKKSPSIQIYQATYNHLISFHKSGSLYINNITPKLLSEFEQHLNDNKVGSRGQNLYLGKIRAIYNRIMDEYEHLGYSFSYPFRKYKLPKVKTPQTVALTKDQLLEIINVNLSGKIRAECII